MTKEPPQSGETFQTYLVLRGIGGKTTTTRGSPQFLIVSRVFCGKAKTVKNRGKPRETVNPPVNPRVNRAFRGTVKKQRIPRENPLAIMHFQVFPRTRRFQRKTASRYSRIICASNRCFFVNSCKTAEIQRVMRVICGIIRGKSGSATLNA